MIRLLPLALIGCASNLAPAFDPLPVDRVVTVGDVVEFPVRARDRAGDPVSYGARGLPVTAHFDAEADPPVFSWAPLISEADAQGREWPITFIAQDDQGARVEARITITVFSGDSRPTFTSPSSFVLDLELEDTLLLPITVRDDDSEAVRFEVVEAPEGAELEEVGPKAALLVWEPSPDQLSRRRVWAVTINAWDERPDDFVQHRVTVVVDGEASN